MGAETGIAWTDHTFNPWWGCVRVSPGCENCYAETWDARLSPTADSKGNPLAPHWGVRAPRRFFGDAHWHEPVRWDNACRKMHRREKVFCASMADVFEPRDDLIPWRSRLWDLIEATPSLDWQLLTKRPAQWRTMLRGDWMAQPRRNVWFGTSVEDQRRANERIPHLLEIPAAVRFLSVEPLLDEVDLSPWMPSFYGLESVAGVDVVEGMVIGSCDWGGCDEPAVAFRNDPEGHGWLPVCREHRGIHWIIIGGESGKGARPCEVAWVRNLIAQARNAGVDVFVKQLGSSARAGLVIAGKGDDPAKWPPDLRVREFPEVRP